MSDQEVIERGRRAEHLLKDDTLSEALETLANAAQAEWRGSRSANYDAREEAYRQVAAIDALRGQLTRWMQDAKLLADKQERQEQRRQTIRRVF